MDHFSQVTSWFKAQKSRFWFAISSNIAVTDNTSDCSIRDYQSIIVKVNIKFNNGCVVL